MSAQVKKTMPMAADASEPREGWGPMPVLLIGLFALLAFGGMAHLADHAGGFDQNVYEPYASYSQVDGLQFVDPVVAKFKHGKQLFEMNCAACHQSSGMGSAAINAPPLAGSEWVNAAEPNRIIRIVLNGLSGPIKVSGKDFGLGVMVPWRDTLKDDQIADILTYIRGNKDWGNAAAAVTPEQVDAIRKKTQDKGGSWNAADLLKLSDKE